ncbi:hypothetical protein TRICI_002598 [Trichomonascus ciferrii]|uniref:DUF866-domain-containing protein n=1 Tax=Trichomonascus ciferrii TaxID=44093 RepID=A0A642V6B4_9ASCO|nr:hypothetical protein TRICI_002598 [Trichomonascus ciferrii]
MLGLVLNAVPSGVTDLGFVDAPENPFEFTFKIQCNSCREIHGNEVNINQYEQHSIQGSRGEANFVFRCKNCKRESSASLQTSKKRYMLEDSGKDVTMLTIDPRGIDFVEFIPVGLFSCKGAESNTPFNEVELEDGEWYDYDEKSGDEVSITDIKWSIKKL